MARRTVDQYNEESLSPDNPESSFVGAYLSYDANNLSDIEFMKELYSVGSASYKSWLDSQQRSPTAKIPISRLAHALQTPRRDKKKKLRLESNSSEDVSSREMLPTHVPSVRFNLLNAPDHT